MMIFAIVTRFPDLARFRGAPEIDVGKEDGDADGQQLLR